MFIYNLQFFGENEDGSENVDNPNRDSDTSDNNRDEGLDAEAVAALIADKDKRIDELASEIQSLKKSNAELTVKISAQNVHKDVPLEQTIVDFCDTRKIK